MEQHGELSPVLGRDMKAVELSAVDRVPLCVQSTQVNEAS